MKNPDNEKPTNRRHLLKALGCCGAAALLGGCKAAENAYSVSDGKRSLCPYGMVNDPFPGFCLAYDDADGDGICDCSLVTVKNQVVAAAASEVAFSMDFTPECPLGHKYDPYPGHCHLYVDSDNSGYCDYSEPIKVISSEGLAMDAPEESAEAVAALPENGEMQVQTGASACPFGLINDPYPGLCQRYVDSDGSGYCDYSEIHTGSGTQIVATGELPAVGAEELPIDFIPTCPFGYTYDPYPGRCNKYIDTDNSGYCDYSEPIGGSLDEHTQSGSGGRGQRRQGRGEGEH